MRDMALQSWPRLNRDVSVSQLLPPGSTVFCDFDGPIADVSDRYYNTYRLALSATQQAYVEKGDVLPVRQLTKAQFWYMKQNRLPDELIADWSGLSGREIEAFLERVGQLVNQPTLLHQDQLQPGARAALHALQDRDVRVVIVTLRQASQVLGFLHHHDLATTISQIYGADDATTAYPNRTEHKVAQLREAISDQNRLGFGTTQSWMIGDTEADVCAGQALGLPTIALTCGIRSSIYLKDFSPTCLQRDLYAAVEALVCSHPTVVAY